MTARMHPCKGSPDYADHRKAQKDTAVRLIERGQHLVPVHIVNPETGRCTCLDRDFWTGSNGKYHEPACAKSNRSWGKHPIDAKWQQSAPLDHTGLDREFSARPYLNLGVLYGTTIKDSPGFLRLVIAVDGRGGHKQLTELEAQLGPLRHDTYTVVTGREEEDGERSGRQYHYAVPAPYAARIKSAAKVLGPDIDIRFVGSQVIAARSTHQNGNVYYALVRVLPGPPAEEVHSVSATNKCEEL